NVNAASSFAARCAVARGGKAASEPTASSAIATCLIRDVAHAQGWCHAPTRAPEYAPSHYATIRAHPSFHKCGSIVTLPPSGPGAPDDVPSPALYGGSYRLANFHGDGTMRRAGFDHRHCCHLAFTGTGSAVGGGDGASASRA